ncbi:calcitonin gene-related peptide type 1 receptor [Pelobates cultripes]|uniref:Calcitonin gene-related peptide type 1 receptor n=1 Tax=Pelobates cultripes TaxID=61616 RepID=A0AAD1SR87_PELCU|nr:calcitonin gene-related peptide type 1 receptor [Pelobates cultripes]
MAKYCIFFHLLIIYITRNYVLASQGEDSEWIMQEENFIHVSVTRNKIMSAQYECYQKIMQEPEHGKQGRFCNRTWDGWLCWGDVVAGDISEQHCPDYFQDFDPSEKVTKECDEHGHWFRHPESNRTWTNYTQCTTLTQAKLKGLVHCSGGCGMQTSVIGSLLGVYASKFGVLWLLHIGVGRQGISPRSGRVVGRGGGYRHSGEGLGGVFRYVSSGLQWAPGALCSGSLVSWLGCFFFVRVGREFHTNRQMAVVMELKKALGTVVGTV